MTHTLPELESVVRAALDCLTASGPHSAAMFHANLLQLDDPIARVAGYRDGSITSLDAAALAGRVPLQSRTPALHAALMACLAAYDAAGRPLYLLRLRFVRDQAGWQLTKVSQQSTEARVRLVDERRDVDEQLRAALQPAMRTDEVRATLRFSDLPGQTTALLGMVARADGAHVPLPLGADAVAATRALTDFYLQRGFVLDSATVALERRANDVTLVCNDYYG